mgnify:CR=1 FL=1
MKLLKISENVGHFLTAGGNYALIDKVTKEDLLRLVDRTLDQDAIELDPRSAGTVPSTKGVL